MTAWMLMAQYWYMGYLSPLCSFIFAELKRILALLL